MSKKIEIDVMGCPWCREAPVFSDMKLQQLIIWVECRNDNCPVSPGTSGISIEDAAKKWNAREQDPLMYPMTFPGEQE